MSLLLLFTPTYWDYRDSFKKRLTAVYKRKFKKTIEPTTKELNKPPRAAVNVAAIKAQDEENQKNRSDYIQFLQREISGIGKQINSLNELRDILTAERLRKKLQQLEISRRILDEELLAAEDQKLKETFLMMMNLTLVQISRWLETLFMPVSRKIYNPKFGWVEIGLAPKETHGILGAAMDPIMCPLDGQTYDDRNDYMKAIKRASDRDGKRYRIIGNDNLGKYDLPKSPKLNYEQMRDAKEYAQSVARDPAKLRAWRNEQNERRAEYSRCGLRDE